MRRNIMKARRWRGGALLQGPPQQIFSEPADPRTQAFLKRIIEAGRL